MARIVNVHHVDYPSFDKGDAEYGDPEELVLVFGTSPSLVEVVEEVRRKLKWMDESDVVDLVGRYNVGFGHIRWKTMSLNSELHCKHIRRVCLPRKLNLSSYLLERRLVLGCTLT